MQQNRKATRPERNASPEDSRTGQEERPMLCLSACSQAGRDYWKAAAGARFTMYLKNTGR